MSDNDWHVAYDVFKQRIGSAIINAVHPGECSGKGEDRRMKMDIWVPGPLNPALHDKGFDYINTDVLQLRQYLVTPSTRLEIISFEDGPAGSTTFNTTINTLCTITPDTILHCREPSDMMTVRVQCRQLPDDIRNSPERLIGCHLRRGGDR